MPLDLTTIARCKTLHGAISTTQLDNKLTALVTQVSRQFEKWLDCEFLKAARTEYIDVTPGQQMFRLRAFPVDTAEAFTVKNSDSGDFASASAINATDYYVDSRRGYLRFRSTAFGSVYQLEAGPGALQVVYNAGLATTTTNLLLTNDYMELVLACEQQVLHDIMRTPNFGSPSRNVGGGSQAFEDDDGSPFIPVVRQALESYLRH